MADRFAQPTRSAGRVHRVGCDARLTWSDDLAIVSVSGAVDMLSAPRLSAAICDALGRSGVEVVIVDLTDVDFLAGVGITVLAAASDAASASFVRFGVVADGPATSRPIRLLALDVAMTLYRTLEDALCDVDRHVFADSGSLRRARSPVCRPSLNRR